MGIKAMYYGWIVVAMSFLMQFLGGGLRSSFGLYFKPLTAEFGWDRSLLSLAASFSTLINGLSQPFVGKLADRHGPRKSVLIGALLMSLCFIPISAVTELWQLVLLYTLSLGLGYTLAGNVPVTALISHWFDKRRGLALGICQAGFSAGQLVLIPVTAICISWFGWRSTFIIFGLVMAAVVPLYFLFVRNRPANRVVQGPTNLGGSLSDPDPESTGTRAITEKPSIPLLGALRIRSFWMLAGGYFVCGYTTNMISTHLAPYSLDLGFSQFVAAYALALMGGFNIIGTLVAGGLCDRFRRKNLLALVYFARGMAMLSLLWIHDMFSLYLFSLVFGFTYYATVPLTSSLCGDLFGLRTVGVTFGGVLLAHQIGGAIGSYIGGYIFDSTGSYMPAFMSGFVLLMFAASVSYLVREVRSPRKRLIETAGY